MDTQNVAGAPDITAAILDAIDRASVVVCDVTPVASLQREGRATRKQIPNPNVMFEAGYAIARHGVSRMVLVRNVAIHGEFEKVFDLHGNREMTYSRAPEARDGNTAPAQLADWLQAAIRTIIQSDEPLPGSAQDRLDLLQLLTAWQPRANEHSPERARIGIILQAVSGSEPRFAGIGRLLMLDPRSVASGWRDEWLYGRDRFANVKRDLLLFWQPSSTGGEREEAIERLRRFADGMDLLRRRQAFVAGTRPGWLAQPNAANPSPYFDATLAEAPHRLDQMSDLGWPTSRLEASLSRFSASPSKSTWKPFVTELAQAERDLVARDPCPSVRVGDK